MSARRFVVSGRVQGVFFRASTRQQAEQLGLTGRAINLSDGRVEVIAHGPPEALDRLGQWLLRGPDSARVEQVEVEAIDEPVVDRFTIG
jgi:acylphosphatase